MTEEDKKKAEVLAECDLSGLTKEEAYDIYDACLGSANIIGCINSKAEEYRIKAVANFNSENLTKQTPTLK